MQRISLDGVWTLSGNGYHCTGNIPGSVYSFLLEQGWIPDPYFRDNELALTKLLEEDYTFSRSFTFQKTGNPVLLRCEGLDTLCELAVNGKLLGSTDNMHRTYEFPVAEYLQEGKNEISLCFRSPIRYIKEKQKQKPLFGSKDPLEGFPHIRKAHCMFGWDWGPRLPDAGIWRSISLIVLDSDRISDVRLLQRHEAGRVYLVPQITTQNGSAEIRVTVTAPDGRIFQIPEGEETEIAQPQLWWPHGYGEQPLYHVTVELLENGVVVDTCIKRIGLREMKLVREKDRYGESFCHEVNGVRIFAMGADYIPEDNLLSRMSEARTRKLLEDCISCNFNTVRVWGGGVYPEDYFFDLCDELGLLVFQDLMFACCDISDDPDFQASVAVEVEQNLCRIRHHACIAVISGNNEIEWRMERPTQTQALRNTYLKLFEDKIPQIVSRICPEIPYISSSPTSCGHMIAPNNENYGDSHYWEVWHGGKPFTEYRRHYFRYLSEFGMESFPGEKTVNAFTLPKDRNIFSRVMELHQRCVGANGKILNYLYNTFLYPTDFSVLLYTSQLLQAESIRYAVEHLRRNRGRCMGALYWQLNDIWPGPSWASIDYFGRFKALQYLAKRFYAPVMISCMEIGETTTRTNVVLEQGNPDYSTQARLCVANETRQPVSGTVHWALRHAEGQVLEQGSQQVTVPALESLWLENMDFHKTDVENHYLYYSFETEGSIVSEGSVLFTAPKHFDFRDPRLRWERCGDQITVYADAYARWVEIDSPDSDFILSDNYFDMNAGSKTVKILSGEPKTIRLRSAYDIR